MAETIEKSLLDLDFASLTRRTFTPSPAAWEDQVLYFLMLDRFSDGKEEGGYRDNDDRPMNTGITPLYRPEDPGRVDYDTWFRVKPRLDGFLERFKPVVKAEPVVREHTRAVNLTFAATVAKVTFYFVDEDSRREFEKQPAGQ